MLDGERDDSAGVTIEEMEAELEKAKEPETPVVPTETPAESAFKAALKISEEARASVTAQLNARPVATAPALAPEVPATDPVEMLSDEQIAQMFEEKGPVAAMRAIQAQTFRIAEKHMETRMSGMTGASVSSAEASARQRYATEFELFGDQIKAHVDSLPNKEPLSHNENWDNLIAFVRGKDGNVQKYAAKLSEGAAATAREEQRAMAGSHTPSVSTPIPSAPGGAGDYGLDATEREIADRLDMSYADYAKWKKI